MRYWMSVALLLGLVGCGVEETPPPSEARFEVVSGMTVPVFANVDLSLSDANKTRAIIVIHGTDRNAEDYYKTIKKIVDDNNRSSSVIAVAPHFQQTGDAGLNGDEIAWKSGWRGGDNSPESNISAFTVVDKLAQKLKEKYTNVTTIIVVGHSAGGQFVQRYAAGTQIDTTLSDVNLSFVVANPSSYLYLHSVRPDANASCSDYDTYKYGLVNRNTYMSAESNETLRTNYAKRYVTYFLGEADTDTTDEDLDKTCEAMTQGAHRYARGTYYMNYIEGNFTDHNHTKVTVPNVGHTRTGMFSSDNGVKLLLGL